MHIASPDWAGGKRKDTTCKILGETVFKALREANNRKVASVAIPAIGCGNYGFPLQNATRTIVKYISNFFREIQDSHIQTVYLVDIKPETVSTFTCAVEDEFDDVERVTQKPDDDNNDKEGNEDDMQFRSSLFKKTLSSKLETQMKSGKCSVHLISNKLPFLSLRFAIIARMNYRTCNAYIMNMIMAV